MMYQRYCQQNSYKEATGQTTADHSYKTIDPSLPHCSVPIYPWKAYATLEARGLSWNRTWVSGILI